jgi:hypothetical protein
MRALRLFRGVAACFFVAAGTLVVRPGLAQTMVISEFMAANSGTLLDEDGELSDWIELYNAGNATVDLLNWSLTDNAGDLAKWRFPSTNVAPGRFLVVFASNKNRRTPGAPLHTNFRLDAAGEFLALVQPDASTITSLFAPEFLPQSADVSYGLSATGAESLLVRTGALARAWVPRDGALGLNWTLPGFDDAAWPAGTTGVGYERASGYAALLGLNLLSPGWPPALRLDVNGDGLNENNSVYIRIPFVVPDPAAVNTLRLNIRHDDGFVAYLNGTRIASDNEILPVDWNSRAASDYGDATDVMMAIVYGPGNDITIYRDGQVYADAAHASFGTLQTYPANVADILIGKRHSDLSDAGGTVSGTDGFLAGSVNEARVYNAALSSADIRRLHETGPLGGTNPPPASVGTNLLHLWSFNDGTPRDSIGLADGLLRNGATIDQGRLVLDGINDYLVSAPIRTNVSVRTLVVWVSLDNLTQQAGSALTLENPAGTDVFDGIIYAERVQNQWMNGSSFFSRSVGDNGGSPETVVETATAGFVSFDVSSAVSALQAGTNVLAIHGLNFSAEDSDMLILPELIGGFFTIQTNAAGYFDQPTPGAMNATGFERLFASIGFSAERGFYSSPFSLSLTSDTPNVSIRFTTDGSVPAETNGFVYTSPVMVSRSTIIRAAGFRAGFRSTEPVTCTYLFLADVLRQSNSAPAGAHWDTEMDPAVVSNSNQTWSVAQGLVDLPVVSIVMANADLFGPNGIYYNPTGRGDDWERAASIEYFYPDEFAGARAGKGFAINCGIQINGNFSRLSHQPKHSFRLVFKDKWGPSKLNYRMFDDYDVEEFDTLLIACGHNQGWSTGIPNTQFLRNRFCWDLAGGAEAGRSFVHSRSVHVYLNGLYWGVYDLNERPDEAFSASNFGGGKEEYDVFKGLRAGGSTQAQIINGNREAWSELFTLAARDLNQASNYAGIERLVDMDQFIDYSIAILYTADRDGPTGWLNGPPNSLEPKNFYATRRRTPEGQFRFWCWDSEFTLESVTEDVSERNGYENPGRLHYNLRTSPEYRVRFADRVQRLFFNDGPFASQSLSNRYMGLAGEIDRAVVSESARWGDSKREPPYSRDGDWVTERNRIVNSYFSGRAAVFFSQLRADGLFPTFAAPTLGLNGAARNGGEMDPGSSLSLSATNGQIYYTLDGSDPRLPGGAISPSAALYSGAVSLADSVVVQARVLSGGQWSALSAATFFVAPDWSRLRITEIMYNPPGTAEVSGEEFEFLELKNTGNTTLPLEESSFTSGIRYRFSRGALLRPGQFIVLARNKAHFAARYPGVRIDGIYDGELDNGGETIRLKDRTGDTIHEMTYGDAAPWPTTPDNLGFSLVPRSSNSVADPDDARSWRASTTMGGSPGADDAPSLFPSVKINEVLSASLPPAVDQIELLNPTDSAVDVGGWFLTDDRAQPRKFRVPSGTILSAGALVVFNETVFNAAGTTNDFALSSRGDQVYLFSADASGNLTGYDHGFAFGAASEGVSFGRHVISTGEEQFPAQITFSPGQTNAGPRIGPVVITEIHYHPPTAGDEFVELENIGGIAVALYDSTRPANTWRVNGLGYVLPPGVVLAAGERLVITREDPVTYRNRKHIASEVRILGPFAGELQRSGERLELQRPGVPDAEGVPFITVDEVRYNDRAPWPVAADGNGPSLQRITPGRYGNDPVHWTAAMESPGAPFAGGTPPVFVSEPIPVTVVAYQDASFQATAVGSAPLSYRWRFNGASVAGATGSTLVISNVQPADAGRYQAVVFNAAGSMASSNVQLTVRIPAIITQQPTNRAVNIGGTASFMVVATGEGLLHYQWRFNGADLVGATNATLTLTNVQPVQEGTYMVVVTDRVGSTPSRPAVLTVWIRPSILVQPESQWVLEGETALFRTEVSGSLPMTYRWRRSGVTLATFTTNALFSTFMLPNVTAAQAGNYAVAISNPGGNASPSSSATLTVLADFDRDGLGDLWEQIYGFNTNNVSDGALDRDGDRMSNRAEFVAGTDPTNPLDFLAARNFTLGPPVAFSFQAISNRSYTVQYTERLGSGVWPVLTNYPSRPTNRIENVTDRWSPTNRFYRLAIP